MAGNLTSQVRISRSHDGRRDGDLSKKITVGRQSEILQLKDTINTMVGPNFARRCEVTRGRPEVAPKANLRQAQVRGVGRYLERPLPTQ